MPFQDRSVVTVDRRRSGRLGLPGDCAQLRCRACASRPEGRRLAVTVRSLDEVGLWLYDLDRGV